MSKDYDHQRIEKKWQERWEADGLYRADDASPANAEYILDMFPYPSGSGLHVGHVEGYTATDIYSRYRRMNGANVLHPMGWDAFGLPAENYAIKTGTPPGESTDRAIENFRRQIRSIGLSYDWSREMGTHRPDYYRWTQWFFLFLYQQGLAEKRMANVNWCPKDQTVLANEQVVDGTCERCGTAVIQKDLEQWFFKITDFADALVSDLDQVDWPESTKVAQRNWIGRSEGALIKFQISSTKHEIEVFTTRPDTISGATFLVVAPEHPLARASTDSTVKKYIEASKAKTEMDRTGAKVKTGVELAGVKAINPATREEIPIYVADYVLMGYGTGAIMAVPDVDERDGEFARIVGAPVATTTLVDAEDVIRTVGGKKKTSYKLRDWLISRQRYWGAPIPIVYDPEGKPHAIPEEHLPWLLPTDVEFKPTGVSPLGQSKELRERTEKIFGKGWTPEVDTMDTFVCSSWYFFRFTDPKNETAFADRERMAEWLPVDLYVGGAEHTVLHLMYARFFTKVLKRAGYIHFDEPFMKLRHQGTILAADGSKMSKSKGNVINPDDVITTYGADSLRLYEMFMGPFEAIKPWNTENIMGVRRFIERVWRLAHSSKDGPLEVETLLHQTIQKVGEDIQAFKFNTAVSSMMIFVNVAEKSGVSKAQMETFLKLLAPFAPHVTEELWHEFGHTSSIHIESWPAYDPSQAVSDTVTIAVQVGGKTRGTVTVPRGASEEEVIQAAKNDARLLKYIDFKPQKIIYVANRILNLLP